MTNNNNTPQRPPSDDLQPGEQDLHTTSQMYKFKIWYIDNNGFDQNGIVEADSDSHAKEIASTYFTDCRYVVKVEQGAIIK